jgi:hypothetical protein
MSDFIKELEKKVITFALWWAGWLIVFVCFGVSDMWTLAVVAAVLAIICMTPLPKKFFTWLWKKIKEGWQKLMEKKK